MAVQRKTERKKRLLAYYPYLMLWFLLRYLLTSHHNGCFQMILFLFRFRFVQLVCFAPRKEEKKKGCLMSIQYRISLSQENFHWNTHIYRTFFSYFLWCWMPFIFFFSNAMLQFFSFLCYYDYCCCFLREIRVVSKLFGVISFTLRCNWISYVFGVGTALSKRKWKKTVDKKKLFFCSISSYRVSKKFFASPRCL